MISLKTLKISLKDRSYNIYLGNSILDKSDDILKDYLKDREVLIVYDRALKNKLNILKISISKLVSKLDSISVNSGEKSKSLLEYSSLCEKIISKGINRRTILIAFGGGVIGDLVGFVASTLLRGINFIQMPTTLLSQVDSSIGGKTGINSVNGKNLIGTFHQPIAVLSDVSLLNTLDKREILSGYAEIVKHSLIKDRKFFFWLEKNGIKIINGNTKLRIDAIYRSCKIKSTIVQKDEYENNQRALLNLGHTFGHAFESYINYDGTLLHGEAVSIGIIMAFKLSKKVGKSSEKEFEQVYNHFTKVGLPTSIKIITNKSLNSSKIWKLMQNDKKVSQGKLNFIIPENIGLSNIRDDIEKKDILSLLDKEIK